MARPYPSNQGQPMPVSRPRAVPGPSRQPQHQKSGIFQSSLDIVWSYSRSQAFFGSNLPSSPSFVQHYMRRPHGTDDDESMASASIDRETTDEDSEGESSGRDTGENESEDWEEEIDISPGENLPRNATTQIKRQQRRSSKKERRPPIGHFTDAMSRDSRSEEAIEHEASESSPLLSSDNAHPPYTFSSSPPDSVPFPRQVNLRKSSSESSVLQKDQRQYNASTISLHGGQSTSAQTLFNSINVLVGIGILAEPLAFAQAGWVLGGIILLYCGLITNYTAKVLARIIARDVNLMTYADIAAKAFGPAARLITTLIFCLELTAVTVAMIVLCADSIHTLIRGSVSLLVCKFIAFLCIIPTIFLPLRLLSITSLVGILSTFVLLFVIILDGALKHTRPGSLATPMPTSVGPEWGKLPLSFGLIMSGFAGHAVMPSLARDMTNPRQFPLVVDLAYIVAFVLYVLTGVLGYLMFGNNVSDEITRDLYMTKGFPRVPTLIAVCMIAVNPICKFAISTRPLSSTIEYILGIEPPNQAMKRPRRYSEDGTPKPKLTPLPAAGERNESGLQDDLSKLSSSRITILQNQSSKTKSLVRMLVKVFTTAIITSIAILIPSFHKIMSFLGAFAAFAIAVHGPILAHLWINGQILSRIEKVTCWLILLISTVMMVTGTVFSFF